MDKLEKTTAIHALCRFDLLLAKIAARGGGVPTPSQKRELDNALEQRSRVCASLGLPETTTFG